MLYHTPSQSDLLPQNYSGNISKYKARRSELESYRKHQRPSKLNVHLADEFHLAENLDQREFPAD